MSIMSKQIEDALKELGDTAEEVANNLLVSGCKGRRRQAFSCPIFLYLESKGLRDSSMAVTSGSVILKHDSAETTPAVYFFICLFDKGEFPMLEL
jgi:hypothetical protein